MESEGFIKQKTDSVCNQNTILIHSSDKVHRRKNKACHNNKIRFWQKSNMILWIKCEISYPRKVSSFHKKNRKDLICYIWNTYEAGNAHSSGAPVFTFNGGFMLLIYWFCRCPDKCFIGQQFNLVTLVFLTDYPEKVLFSNEQTQNSDNHIP